MSTKLGMRHLAALETNRDLDLVALFKKLLNRSTLEINVVFVRGWTHADFFEEGDLLVLTCLSLFLVLLELVFAVIEQTTDRWKRGRSYLDEIDAALLGHS